MGIEFKQENWVKAADLFDKCGNNIERIVLDIIQYCYNDVGGVDKIPELLLENSNYATKAYSLIQLTK